MDINKIKKNQQLILASIAEEIGLEKLFNHKKEVLVKNRRLLAIEVFIFTFSEQHILNNLFEQPILTNLSRSTP